MQIQLLKIQREFIINCIQLAQHLRIYYYYCVKKTFEMTNKPDKHRYYFITIGMILINSWDETTDSN